MITTPDDYTWLIERVNGACLTYIRGLTAEEVIVRRGAARKSSYPCPSGNWAVPPTPACPSAC